MKMRHDHKQIQVLLVTYGELDGATRRQVDEHLAHCPACTAVFAAHRQTDHLLRTWTAQKEQQLRQQPTWSTGIPPLQVRQVMQRVRTPRRDNLLFRLAGLRTPLAQAAGAGALLLLLGLLVLSVNHRLSTVTPVRAGTPASTMPVATATPTAAQSEIRPSLPVSGEQTMIRFAINRHDQENYLALVREFESANPDIQVELVPLEEILGVNEVGWISDGFAKVAAAADVIEAFISSEAIDHGYIRNLKPFLADDPTFAINDYYPNVLTPYQQQDALWALPAMVNVALIYYDKDAFDEAGVAYPQPGWTWEEFVATAKALTKRQGNAVQRWGYVESWYSPQSFLESQAGPLFDTRTEPVTSRLLNADVLTAFQRYVELYTVHKVSPYEARPKRSDYTNSSFIALGAAAMWSGTFMEWDWRDQGHNLGVVPYPVNSKRTNTSQVDTLLTIAMSAQSRHPKEAWRWMSFFSTKIPKPYLRGISLPARKSVAEATQAWEKLNPELVPSLRYALTHSYPRSYPYYAIISTEVWEALDTAFAAILQGQKAVDDAMVEVQKVVQHHSQVTSNPPPAQCQISTPTEGATVNGSVSLRGTATNPNFAYYHVLYKPRHGTHKDWGFLFEEKEPVQEGVLGRLDSTILPNGPYTLSLRVVDQAGNYAECLMNIDVRN